MLSVSALSVHSYLISSCLSMVFMVLSAVLPAVLSPLTVSCLSLLSVLICSLLLDKFLSEYGVHGFFVHDGKFSLDALHVIIVRQTTQNILRQLKVGLGRRLRITF